MTKKNMLRSIGILVLCLAICLSSVACRRGNNGEASAPVGTTGTGSMNYTICVNAETGMPLEEIGVYIYTDSTMSELVWFAKTDAEGKLSFSDIPSDNFVAVLDKVPAGYLVEEYYPLTGELTEIKLSAGLMEGDLSSVTYKLGDLMLDFSVTGPDGTEYKFSELLEQKKAVILNFWYLQCEPCKAEFPHLQEAYEKYSDDVALLVMNPVNQDNAEIEQFRKDNGYTFPMMACDPMWEKAMQITAYPTTVVIDRNGYITLRHTGSIDGPETFEAMMSYFSAEEYEHTVFKNLDELVEAAGVEQEVGTAENPIELGLMSSFQVTVEPGQEMHYNIYRIANPVTLSMSNPDAYVIYNGKQYNGTNIRFTVTSDGPNSLVPIVFGNKGTETQTYTVYMTHKQGSPDNPIAFALDAENKQTLNVSVGAGDSQGMWYGLASPGDGFLTIEVESVTPGTNHEISVASITTSDVVVQTNLSEGSTTDPETGRQKLTAKVFSGGRVKISFGSLDTSYPAVSFKVNISFSEGDVGTDADKKIIYSVNVTDENRKPVAGIMLDVDMNGTPVTITTDESGAAYTKLEPATYKVTMREPNGYRARTLTYKLTEKTPSISIRLQTVITREFIVTVLDEAGKALPDAFVTIGNMALQTDENGIAVFKLEEGSYNATVAKVGYYEESKVALSTDSPNATVTLKINPEAHFLDYTVQVQDYYGTNTSGVKVNYYKNGAALAGVTTDASGKAVIKLEPGTYTVDVEAPYYLVSGNITLTEETSGTTVKVVRGITTQKETYTAYVGTDEYGFAILSEYPAYAVSTGAVYVTLNSGYTNYFYFAPGAASGLYEISIVNNSALLSQWSSTGYMQVDNQNKLTINHKDSHDGNEYVIGVNGSGGAVLMITRVGDFIKDDSDLPKVDYAGTHTPVAQNITVPSGKTLTYVDVVNGKLSDYMIELGSDGCYYLQDGTKLYVQLGSTSTKPPYMCVSDMIGVTDSYASNTFYSFVTDENGVKTHMERYESLLISYCEAVKSSSLGLYPLTKDLAYMLYNGGVQKGWYDITNPNYIIKDNNQAPIAANEELAWMFAVCYFK